MLNAISVRCVAPPAPTPSTLPPTSAPLISSAWVQTWPAGVRQALRLPVPQIALCGAAFLTGKALIDLYPTVADNPAAVAVGVSILAGLALIPEAAGYAHRLLQTAHFLLAPEHFLHRMIYDSRASAEVSTAWHELFGSLYAPGRDATFRFTNIPNPDRPLKIGYVSGDLGRGHPVDCFVGGLLRQHRQQQFETFVYVTHDQPQKLPLAGKVRNVCNLTDVQLHRLIRQDRIDILVDLTGHFQFGRLPLFARRPAPLQVAAIGYPHKTGLTTIDYRLTDMHADPEEQGGPEKLWRLPGSFLAYTPAPDLAKMPLASPPSMYDGYVSFGVLNNPDKYKNDSETLDAWACLMRELPTARLVFKYRDYNAFAWRTVKAQLLTRGVDLQRVVFVNFATEQDEPYIYYRVDITLEPFHYHGTLTICEGLHNGVPTVAKKGDRHASRVACSILAQVGLSDLVTANARAYVDTCKALAADGRRLMQLRATLRDTMQASPLCNVKQYTQNIEAAYRQMWQTWCRSE